MKQISFEIRGAPKIEVGARIRIARERRAWYTDTRRSARPHDERAAFDVVQSLRAGLNGRRAPDRDLSLAA